MPYSLLSPYQTTQTRATIGLYLRRLRLEKGLSQNLLARQAGMPGSTISKLENGLIRLTQGHLDRLEKILSFSPDDVEDLTRILALQYMNEVSQQILDTYPE